MPRHTRTASGGAKTIIDGITVWFLQRNAGRKAGVYSAKFALRGKQYMRSTGCTTLEAATAAAARLVRDVRDGHAQALEASKFRRTVATVGQAVEYYRSHRGRASAATAEDNIRALLRWLRETGAGEHPEDVRLSDLTAERLERWIATRQGRQHVDRSELLPVNVGINSDLRRLKSVFGRAVLPGMGRELQVPDLSDLLGVPGVCQHVGAFEELDADRLRAMDEHFSTIGADQPHLWLAYWAMRLLGLRNSELFRARRHWIGLHEGVHELAIIHRPGECRVKGTQERRLEIPAQLLVPFLRAEDYLIPLPHRERWVLLYRTLSEHVRKFFPAEERGKSSYLLRKQRAAEWLADGVAIYDVAYLLGDTVATVERNYATQLRRRRRKISRLSTSELQTKAHHA